MTGAAGSANSPSPATLMQTPRPQRTHNLCGPVRRMTCSATVSVVALCFEAVSSCLKVACPGGRLENMGVLPSSSMQHTLGWQAEAPVLLQAGCCWAMLQSSATWPCPGSRAGIPWALLTSANHALSPALQDKLGAGCPKALPALCRASAAGPVDQSLKTLPQTTLLANCS